MRTREGKYKFWLVHAGHAATARSPSAEAVVCCRRARLDRLRMNQEEMKQAAEETQGRFYTLATADRVLDDCRRERVCC